MHLCIHLKIIGSKKKQKQTEMSKAKTEYAKNGGAARGGACVHKEHERQMGMRKLHVNLRQRIQIQNNAHQLTIQPVSRPYCSTNSATFARAPGPSEMELHLGRRYHDITQFIFAYKLINYTNATRCTVCECARARARFCGRYAHALHGR